MPTLQEEAQHDPLDDRKSGGDEGCNHQHNEQGQKEETNRVSRACPCVASHLIFIGPSTARSS
jgi:hypothetical protein